MIPVSSRNWSHMEENLSRNAVFSHLALRSRREAGPRFSVA